VFATQSAAQQLSLSGTVRDNAGVIPGATVVLSSGGSQVSTVTTDEGGSYRFPALMAGSFELTFSMRGFETISRTVTLTSDTPAIDVVMSVGRVSTTLTVTASGGKATATRLPVANDEVPAQVSSIPQELIRQQGFNTVGEALQNASGVQAVRWYGAYEQYTIRGFSDPDRDSFNVVLLDGMRMGGNRYATQTNNIQSVEVLKGPSSVLYGRGAVGGTINIVRKKPQAVRAYDFSYRGGRFNTHQIAGGATGAVGGSEKFLYRLDSSLEHSDGWRDAGADRFNLSPALTWLMTDTARLTVHQTFNRDRFDGDGGVPLNIIDLASFKPELRFSLPQDRVLVEDSQTQVLFNGNLSPKWEFRNSLMIQRTSDKYFVTEGVYGDPDADEVFREPLDFHHIRRPIQNQSELVGRLGGHNLLFGYEYQRDKYRTEVTAGDDPDCLCGYWWLTIAPMNISTLEETQTPLDIETIERTTVRRRPDQFVLCAGSDRPLAAGEAQHRGPRRRLRAQCGSSGWEPVHAGSPRRDGVLVPCRHRVCAALRSTGLFRDVEFVHASQHCAARRFPTRSQHRAQLRGGSSLAGMERPCGHEPRRVSHHPQQRDGAGVGHDVPSGWRADGVRARRGHQHGFGRADVFDLQLRLLDAPLRRCRGTERSAPAIRSTQSAEPVGP
jgi:hypothetical protein